MTKRLKHFLVRNTEDEDDKGIVLLTWSHHDAIKEWLELFSHRDRFVWEASGAVHVHMLDEDAYAEGRRERLFGLHFTIY